MIGDFLPEYEFRGIRSIPIQASPADIFRALKAVTLADMPIAHFFGELRYLPVRMIGKMRTARNGPRPFLDIVLQSGNIILGEKENRELVVGAIAKFHRVFDQQFAELKDTRAFIEFSDPDYEKLAQSFRLTCGSEGAADRLIFEHRTHALGPSARKKFSRYWIFIKPGSWFLVGSLLRAIKRLAEAKP